MKEFAYGTSLQFSALDKDLSSGKKYKFEGRILPDSCSVDRACIWFAKMDDVYCLFIEKGITTSVENDDFKFLLERGMTKFVCMDDMVSFFRSLQPLFPEQDKEDTGTISATETIEICESLENGMADTYMIKSDQERAINEIVDKQKLKEIKTASNRNKRVWPEEIASPLKKKVFGQEPVIDALADKIVINQIRKDRKLLAIALIGPTATGKSETAKSLAEVMSEAYGTQYGYIEIAGSEFIGEHTIHRFFGAPPGYVGHGQATVLEPIRQNPYHVIVINEIEKADDKILVGLMEAIDTGVLGMADNSKAINLNKCILLFTSNIPIDLDKYEELSEFEQAEMCRDAFTKHCGRPEISGKIGNFLVFRPLSDEATTDIIIKFVREELEGYDLGLAHIDEYLMADFLSNQTKYGARGIRGLVSDSIGRHLLKNKCIEGLSGKMVTVRGTIDSIEFDIV